MSSPFAPFRLAPEARARLLNDVVARCGARQGRHPAVVFDLDGTLLDNRPRVVKILHELALTWHDKHPDAARVCAAATSDDIVYGFVENLKRLGVVDPALHDEGYAFWRARFFYDEHVRHDVEVAGASAFVRACHVAGANVVYLTGRDLPNMAVGSFASLRDLGFPIGVLGTQLVTKPTFDLPDFAFKAQVLPDLARVGTIVAAFDNESANCNLFAGMYRECTTVFVDTQHAPDPPPLHPSVRVIDTFEMTP